MIEHARLPIKMIPLMKKKRKKEKRMNLALRESIDEGLGYGAEYMIHAPSLEKTRIADVEILPEKEISRKSKGLVYALTYEDEVYAVKQRCLGSKYDNMTMQMTPAYKVDSAFDSSKADMKARLKANEMSKFYANPEMFQKANECCTKAYQETGILENGRNFGSTPALYVTVSRRGEVVATLGYEFSSKSTEEVYDISFDGETHIMTRFYVDSTVGNRIEVLPVKIVEMRGETEKWEKLVLDGKAKKYGGNYFRKISIRQEIGRLLLSSVLHFYQKMVKHFKLRKFPKVVFASHPAVIKFFVKANGGDFLKKYEGICPHLDKIDSQSQIAFILKEFRLYEVILEKINCGGSQLQLAVE